MGCDIHMAVEVKNGHGWKPVKWPNPYFGKYEDNEEQTLMAYHDRDYNAFSILANVRNGSGFAGCDTGDGFKFIAAERGLPEDCTKEVKKYVNESGDHSHTWLTLAEILAFDWTQRTKLRGWVDAVVFEEWDRMKQWKPWPKEWSGGISGGLVEHISIQEMRARIKKEIGEKRGAEYTEALERFKARNEHTYCLIEWDVSYADAAKAFWVEWVPKFLRLGKPEDVRLVMSFDS